jgi:hypothetical protein
MAPFSDFARRVKPTGLFMQPLNQYIRFRSFVHIFFEKSEAVGIEILCVIADELQIKCLKKQC